MSVYCDSSFLIAIYCQDEEFSLQARRTAAAWMSPPLLTGLTELETINGFHRKVFRRTIGQPTCQQMVRTFRHDLRSKIFIHVNVNYGTMFRDAVMLSDQFSSQEGHRSLDLLHLAAAQMLKATDFLSFDARLNALAKKLKFRVLDSKGKLS